MTTQTLLKRYERDLALRGFSPTTRKTYYRNLVWFLERASADPLEITGEEIKDYLYHPIEVIKARYSMLFLESLKRIYKSSELYLDGTGHEKPDSFRKLLDSLFSKEWVVFLKKSFKNSHSIIEYLSRYTHKTAICNYRIVSADAESVRFNYRDYRDGNKEKVFLKHKLYSSFNIKFDAGIGALIRL